MNKILFFFSLIVYISHNYAAQAHTKKPSYRDIALINNHYYQEKYLQLEKPIPAVQKKEVPSGHFFCSYKILPPEIQSLIIHFATNGTSAKNLKAAIRTTRALLVTNKQFHAWISKPPFSDNLITNLATKYICSHETVAKSLHTKQSKERLALQYKLKALCCSEKEEEEEEEEKEKNSKLSAQLNKLVSDGVNLEFTYNHQLHQKTPLMMTMNFDNNIFELLLEHGADINGTNSLGVSALQLSIGNPINENYCMQLITNPTVAINQQNNRGETAFLYCLTRKKRNKRSNEALTRVLKELLKAGASPECPDKNGLTPLKAAKELRKTRAIINIIQQAITKNSPIK